MFFDEQQQALTHYLQQWVDFMIFIDMPSSTYQWATIVEDGITVFFFHLLNAWQAINIWTFSTSQGILSNISTPVGFNNIRR